MVDSFHLSTKSTSEVLNIGKNTAVLVWRSCLILRQCSWYFCLTFFPGTKKCKSKECCSTAWRSRQVFLSQTVTWALKGRENSSVFYVFLKLWNIHIVQELWLQALSLPLTAPRAESSACWSQQESFHQLERGWIRLSTTQKCKHCSPGSQRSSSLCQLNKPCPGWVGFVICATKHIKDPAKEAVC